MPVTTPEAEYTRLRQYLSSYIRGPNTTAILNAIASAASTYLVNSAAAVNDSLYITTSQGQFLDLRLADYGITRDPTIGLSNDVFSALGIQVKNRKQVRDLINNILDIVFGDQFVKATSASQNIEPYDLRDGDQLIINFDGTNTATVTLTASQFGSIAAATAQEVANAISIGLSNLGIPGSAIVNNDGNGNYVELLSSTIGASSSITVLGGRAQNVLVFQSIVAAGGNFSTQWTITLRPGGVLRFTWSGGADPDLGVVEPQQYVNIFGGGFASSSEEGSYPILASQGGTVNLAFFEVFNPLGNGGIITQGADDAVLFYTPTRETIISKQYYAAVYQVQANKLQIFMPATTQIVKRSRIGSFHLHGISEQPVLQLVLLAGNTFPATGIAEYYLVEDFGKSFQYYVWFNVNGGNTDPAPPGFTGIEVMISSSDSPDTVATKANAAIATAVPAFTTSVTNNIVNLTIQVASTIPDAGPSTPENLGNYIFDTQQGFVVGGASTVLTQDVNGETGRVVFVNSSVGFPNNAGYVVFGYGTELQEVVPYIATPSSGSIIISPAYFMQNDHPIGSSVLLVTSKAPIVLPGDGSFYQPYLTDTAAARVYAQQTINTIVAAGVFVTYTILYPSPIGIGGWENTIANEISYIYGP